MNRNPTLISNVKCKHLQLNGDCVIFVKRWPLGCLFLYDEMQSFCSLKEEQSFDCHQDV